MGEDEMLITAALAVAPGERLKTIKETLPEHIDYSVIKLVQAHVARKGNGTRPDLIQQIHNDTYERVEVWWQLDLQRTQSLSRNESTEWRSFSGEHPLEV